MKLIKEIRDSDAFGKKIEKSKEGYKIRIAARAIILDENNNIAILSTPKSKHYHHKLPGGGLEEGEDFRTTLNREIKEETGYSVDIGQEIGKIIEYKNEYNQKQISYCFLARLRGEKEKPNLTKKEKEAGYKTEWMHINDAIKLFDEVSTKDSTANFIRIRDRAFLLEAQKILKIK